jgi:benzoyl-CoA 2,3-dioxygenase component A
LTGYHVAFSRAPNAPKQYVQHRLHEQADELLADVRNGSGHVYICGDANMAAGVQEAMAMALGNASIIEQLRSAGRYHEDVFGAPLNL